MLGKGVHMVSSGTLQEAAEILEGSGLQELHHNHYSIYPYDPVNVRMIIDAAASRSEEIPDVLEACCCKPPVISTFPCAQVWKV